MYIVKLWFEDSEEHFLEITSLSKLEIDNLINMLREFVTIDGKGESYQFSSARFETGATDDRLELHIFLARLS